MDRLWSAQLDDGINEGIPEGAGGVPEQGAGWSGGEGSSDQKCACS